MQECKKGFWPNMALTPKMGEYLTIDLRIGEKKLGLLVEKRREREKRREEKNKKKRKTRYEILYGTC